MRRRAQRTILAFAVVLVAVPGATDASTGSTPTGTPPRAGYRIVFVRYGSIMSMAPDGSDVRGLTSGSDVDPVVSPDGRLIAFDRLIRCSDIGSNGSGERWSVFVMDSSGGNVTEVAGGAFDAVGPRWAPDATRLAFIERRATTESLVVANPDGARAVVVAAATKIPGFSWSPDGTRLAFGRTARGRTDIWRVRADGSMKQRLTSSGGASDPEWRPHAAQIAFTRRDGIYEMSETGAFLHRVVAAKGLGSVIWSPGGAWFAFERTWSCGFYCSVDVFVARASGSSLRRLTNDEESEEPSWSPNGRLVTYTRGYRSQDGAMHGIVVRKADGTEPRKLTNEYDAQPHWVWLASAPPSIAPDEQAARDHVVAATGARVPCAVHDAADQRAIGL